jgi:hypothetical protein
MKFINEKLETLSILGNSDNTYCISIVDKKDKVLYIAAPRASSKKLNEIMKSSNWKQYDKDHSEFIDQKFCKCSDCLKIRKAQN